MGYFAKAQGGVTLKEDVDKNQLENHLRKINDTEIDFDLFDHDMMMWDSDTHWNEDSTLEFLNELNPYITDGCMTYTGEDDSIWRYKYNPENETWDEEFATIDFGFESYSDDDLISELTKRGYTVTKDTK